MNERDSYAGAFREGDPPPTARANSTSPVCKMCSKGTITRNKVYRMHWIIVAFGYVVLFVFPALWVLLLVAYLLNPPARPGTPLERAYESFASGLARDFLACVGILVLIAAPMGWLLSSKKTVLKCSHCGVEVPTSLNDMYDKVP